MKGKEIAENLDKKAARTTFVRPESFCEISSSGVLDKLRCEVEQRKSKYWKISTA